MKIIAFCISLPIGLMLFCNVALASTVTITPTNSMDINPWGCHPSFGTYTAAASWCGSVGAYSQSLFTTAADWSWNFDMTITGVSQFTLYVKDDVGSWQNVGIASNGHNSITSGSTGISQIQGVKIEWTYNESGDYRTLSYSNLILSYNVPDAPTGFTTSTGINIIDELKNSFGQSILYLIPLIFGILILASAIFWAFGKLFELITVKLDKLKEWWIEK